MTARELFQRGQRVQLSPEGRRRDISRSVSTGRVVGFGRSVELVVVLRDGLKTPMSFHYAFWAPLDGPVAS